jgi:SRSO17 transposase
MEVQVWDKKEERAGKRVLVISRNIADNKIKYGLSNAGIIKTPVEQSAFMQAQRYWIERSLQECKSELGMSDYQIRKWNGQHHHMALVMSALSFIVKERIKNQDNCPLLSCRDIRILIIALLTDDELLIQKRMLQMQNRHRQREKDTQRYLKT